MKSTMKRPLILATCLVSSAFLLGGCMNRSDYGKLDSDRSATALGLVSYEEGSYAKTSVTGFALESDNFLEREDIGGKKVSLFWGLFHYTDYSAY